MSAIIYVRDASDKTLASYDTSWHRYEIVASCGMDPLRLCGINIDTRQSAGTVDVPTAANFLREVTAWCRALLELWRECAPRDSLLRSLFSERQAEQMRSELDRLVPDDTGRQRVLAFFHAHRL